MSVEFYWIDTGWACGGIKVRDGRAVGGAPIFRKFKNERIEKLSRIYTVVKIFPRKNSDKSYR